MPESQHPDDQRNSESTIGPEPDSLLPKQADPSAVPPDVDEGEGVDDIHAETTFLFSELSTHQKYSAKSFQNLKQFLEAHDHPSIPVESIELLARFVDLQVIGEGSFGVVLRGFDSVLERPVAIKVLRAVDDEEFERRFLVEARRMARLDHPGICRVHDFGAIDGRSYIVTEWIEGTTLAEIETPLKWERACSLIAELAEAMAHAHGAEVIHRDLKPANIMIDERERVRVIDFGLSIGSDEQLTSQIEYCGSPASMAPEQIRGRIDLLDARVDIWAMGIVLYELLTGMRPFRGATRPELLDKILHKPVPPPRTFDAAIPTEVESIVLNALAKEPDDRIPTATEFAERLRRCLEKQLPDTTTGSSRSSEFDTAHSSHPERADSERPAGEKAAMDDIAAEAQNVGSPDGATKDDPSTSRSNRDWRLAAVCGVLVVAAAIGIWMVISALSNRLNRDELTSESQDAATTVGDASGDADVAPQESERFFVSLSRPESGIEWAIDGTGAAGYEVEDGDAISLSVELSDPKHVYLVWIGTDTGITHLYPGPIGSGEVIGDPELDRPVVGFQLEVGNINKTPSTETALMIALEEPLADASELRRRLVELPIPSLTRVLPSGSFRGVHFKATGKLSQVQTANESLPPGVREAVQETIDFLRSEFGSSATIQAVSFASGDQPKDAR